jgi:hypothetical protein
MPRLEHDVGAAPAGGLANGRVITRGARVEQQRGPEAAQDIVLGQRGRRQHFPAREPHQLAGGDADAAGGRVHHHPIAGLDWRQDPQHEVGRDVVERQSGGGFIAHTVRHRESVGGRHADCLCIAAEAAQRRDALAHPTAGNAGADGVDHPGDLVAGDAGQRRRIRIQSEPDHHVGEVHARQPGPDADLTGGRRRLRRLAQDEGLGSATPGQHHLSQACPFG